MPRTLTAQELNSMAQAMQHRIVGGRGINVSSFGDQIVIDRRAPKVPLDLEKFHYFDNTYGLLKGRSLGVPKKIKKADIGFPLISQYGEPIQHLSFGGGVYWIGTSEGVIKTSDRWSTYEKISALDAWGGFHSETGWSRHIFPAIAGSPNGDWFAVIQHQGYAFKDVYNSVDGLVWTLGWERNASLYERFTFTLARSNGQIVVAGLDTVNYKSRVVILYSDAGNPTWSKVVVKPEFTTFLGPWIKGLFEIDGIVYVILYRTIAFGEVIEVYASSDLLSWELIGTGAGGTHYYIYFWNVIKSENGVYCGTRNDTFYGHGYVTLSPNLFDWYGGISFTSALPLLYQAADGSLWVYVRYYISGYQTYNVFLRSTDYGVTWEAQADIVMDHQTILSVLKL